MTYALLIYNSLPAGQSLPEDQEAAVLERHRALQEQTRARGQLHAVARLTDCDRARTVRVVADGPEVTDGPFMESKEWLVGFYLVDCDDEAQALERARSICPTSDHCVEVRPVRWHGDE